MSIPPKDKSPKTLKAVKHEVRYKRSEVRQCRLCLRVLGREDVRETSSIENDIRRKILDAAGVKIIIGDKVTTVCINCLRMVDIIYSFRMACRKTNMIHETKLMMLHPGKWLGSETQTILGNCQEVVKRHRNEIDGLFKCTGLEKGEVHRLTLGKEEVVLQSKEEPDLPPEELSDSEPEMSVECAKKLDAPVGQTYSTFRSIQKGLTDPGTVPNHKFVCEICGLILEKNKAEYHANKHLEVRPYLCSQDGCGEKFYCAKSARQHEKTQHTDFVKRYQCEICNKMIKGKGPFNFHVKGHTIPETKKAPCPVCGKWFYKTYVKDHMAIHTGEMNYKCEYCGKEFAAHNNLITHRKKHHSIKMQQDDSS